jgi:zinc transporter
MMPRMDSEDLRVTDYHATGILFAFDVSGDGIAKAVPGTALSAGLPPRDDGVLWVHLNRTYEPARRWVRKVLVLESPAIEALLEDDARPTWSDYPEGLLVVLSDVRYGLGGDAIEMGTLRLWLDRTRLISLRRKPMAAVKRLKHEVEHGHAPSTPGEMFTRLLVGQVETLDPIVERMIDTVDDIEDEMLAGRISDLRSRLGQVRRDAVRLRRHILPQRRALAQMLARQPALLTDKDLRRLRETIEDSARQLEDVDAVHERAKVLQDELAALLSEVSNHNLFILSLVTVVFTPLTFIASIFGMNVAGLPGLHDHWAFFIVCALMAAVGLLTLLWLRRREWF